MDWEKSFKEYSLKGILLFIALVVSIYFIVFHIFVTKPAEMAVNNKVNITFNFLLRPYFQTEPRVFIDGGWKSLPNSQSNILSEDGTLLVVCGKGGLYIYNTTSDNVSYVYNQDWYPCYNIFFVDENKLGVETLVNRSSGKRTTFDVNTKTIIGTIYISESEVLSRYEDHFNSRSNEFNESCTQDKSLCATLNEDNTVSLIQKDGSIKTTDISNAIALVGFKNNIIFFATSDSYGGITNHNLYAFDINEGISEKLLDDFRYDYEMLVFF